MAVYNIIYGGLTDYDSGRIGTGTVTWEQISTNLGGTSTAGGNNSVTSRFSGRVNGTTYDNFQTYQIFDTSALSGTITGASLSVNISTAATDTHDIHIRPYAWVAASSGGRSRAQLEALSLVASATVGTGTGRFVIPYSDPTSIPASATYRILTHDARQLTGGTAPTATIMRLINSADQTGTTSDPFLIVTIGTPWAFVGVSNVVEVTATSHPLVTTGISGLAAGDLLIACISSRIASTTSVTLPSGWTLVSEQKNNNILSTSSALPSAVMAYCIRGASDPALTFTHPVAPAPALGRIVAYRGAAAASTLDAQTSFTTAIATLAVTGAGLTTTVIEDLIVAMAAGGQESAWSAFNATDPAGASGSTVTTVPTTTWSERADSLTTTGNDTSLAIFDAVKLTAGATGNLTATASVSSGQSVVAGAFKIATASVTHYTMPAAAGAFTLAGVDATLSRTTAVAGTSLDPAKTSANITLSNSNLTATRGSSSAYYASTLSTPSGNGMQLYVEVDVKTVMSDQGIGVSNATIADSDTGGTNNWLGWNTTSIGVWNGLVYYNGLQIDSLGIANANDIVAAAVNRYTQTIQFNNLTQASGWSSGYSISSLGTGPLYFGFSLHGAGVTKTANFNGPFFSAPPAGYATWGSTHYTMPAAAGTFALAGQAATPRIARKLTAASGAFALAGQVAGLRTARNLLAVKGTFTLTGVDATLTRSTAVVHRTMPADAGVFALAGQAAVLRSARKVTAAAGSFAVAGQAAGLRYGRAVVAVKGAFTLDGQIAGLCYGHKTAVPLAGVFTLSGQIAALRYVRKIQMVAVSGAFTLTGQTANLVYLRRIRMASDSGAFLLNGQPANLIYSGSGDKALPAAAGAFTLSGQAAGLRATHRPLAAATGAFALSGQAAVLRATRKPLTVVQGTFTLAGQTATLTKSTAVVNRVMPAAAGAVTVSGKAAVFYYAHRLVVESGAVVVSGKPASLIYAARQNYTMAAASGIVRLEGIDVTMSRTRIPPPIRQENLKFGRSVYVSRW